MQYEYAVIDEHGQLMGMPARTYGNVTAAQSVLDMLNERIEAMRQAAEKARRALEGDAPALGVETLSANDRAMCREMVETYEANKDNSYRVMRRQVGAWEAVA